jgi:2,4-dichlorophenol 6-monooxygenase
VAAASGVPLDALRIGHVDGDLFDPRCTWLRQRGTAADGAVLIRPDRFVAWRSLGAADDPAAELSAALETILAQRSRTHA